MRISFSGSWPLGLFIYFACFYGSCKGTSTKEGNNTPNVLVSLHSKDLYKSPTGWRYKGRLFSGYITQHNKDLLISKVPVINGWEEGFATIFYEDGRKWITQTLVKGRLQGNYFYWWRNGNLRYQFNYENNVYHGAQKVFFEDGKLREESNYENGVLEGKQQVWDTSGRLVSNYTIKNKKLYGIVSVKSCMPGLEH